MTLLPETEKFLAAAIGMDLEAAGRSVVGRAVSAAMRREDIPDPKEYQRLLHASIEARQRLIDSVVVGETWFFRDRSPFSHLALYARERQQERPGDVLKILSAPCSTGEEPYSIVITLLNAGLPSSSFTVDALDISADALDKARIACYGSGSFRGSLPEDAEPFFEMTPQGRQVAKDVVRQVSFLHGNLASPDGLPEHGSYEIIFCRNLLIYLTTAARLQVFKKLDSVLVPGGLLFAGHTEAIFWHQQGYLPLKWDRSFALAKPAGRESAWKSISSKSPQMPAGGQTERRKTVSFDWTDRHEALAAGPRAAMEGVHRHFTAASKSIDAALAEALAEARRLADKGDLAAAFELCMEFRQKNYPAAEIYGLMGVIQMARQDQESAEECFLKALYLDPGHYESLVHLSLIYRQKGDGRKASLYQKRARKAEANNKMKVSVT